MQTLLFFHRKSTCQTMMPDSSRVEPWRPPAVIWLSVSVHLVSLVLLLVRPTWWPWIIGALVGNHLLLCLAVLFPRASILGPNLVRLPAHAAEKRQIALTFDDGPDVQVTPRVLEVLDRYQAKASFFCIGEKAAVLPDLVREIGRRGHSVENHSHRHPNTFAFHGFSALRREVEAAQAAIGGITGRAPRFFRAPAGFRSPMLDPVLARNGLRYISWTRRGFDAVRSDPVRVLASLRRDLAAGDVLLLHDGAPTRTASGEPVVLAVLPKLLDEIAARGLKPVSLPAAFDDAAAG
jgi:peptidoglycan/xylan/chitin deacetylase (PgdA/CDA1 family)